MNCSYSQDSSSHGIWYSSFFGVVEISKTGLNYYPIHSPKETWPFDVTLNAYKYEGTLYKPCSITENKELYSKIDIINKEQIHLFGSENCFLKHPFGNEIILHRIPEKIDLEFEKISFSANRDNKWNEVVYNIEELKELESKSSLLSIEKQIWVLFNSGINFNASCEHNRDSNIIYVKIIGKGTNPCKKVNAIVLPAYIMPLFEKVDSDLK